jgi:hypothetical protein
MWSARRLWTVAVLAALVQVGLIYWASDRTAYVVRPTPARPPVQFAALSHSELLALTDPTVFSRAHPNGFSGAAWLTVPAAEYRVPESSGAPQWLALAPAQLGGALREYVRTNLPAVFAGAIRPQPALTQPSQTSGATVSSLSTVQVVGPLAARELMNFPPLPAQTNADILLPSEVQLLVDARGNPISAVLLPPGSGLKAADQLAVALARAAQFAPDPAALLRSASDTDAGVISGRMVFRWHTAPAPVATNGTTNPR